MNVTWSPEIDGASPGWNDVTKVAVWAGRWYLLALTHFNDSGDWVVGLQSAYQTDTEWISNFLFTTDKESLARKLYRQISSCGETTLDLLAGEYDPTNENETVEQILLALPPRR